MNAALVKSFALVALIAAAGSQNALADIPSTVPTAPCSQENDGDLYTVTQRTREGTVAWTYQCVAYESGSDWQLILRCDDYGCVAY